MNMFEEMSEVAKEMAEKIELKLGTHKGQCQEHMLADDDQRYVEMIVMETMDKHGLSHEQRCEVLDWFETEYGLRL